MVDILEKLLGVTIAVFMAGSLLEMGLKLNLKKALQASRDVRFMAMAPRWRFCWPRHCPSRSLTRSASSSWVWRRVRRSYRYSRNGPERT
jgi:hypothetical protein